MLIRKMSGGQETNGSSGIIVGSFDSKEIHRVMDIGIHSFIPFIESSGLDKAFYVVYSVFGYKTNKNKN